jgi:hypothetical protein
VRVERADDVLDEIVHHPLDERDVVDGLTRRLRFRLLETSSDGTGPPSNRSVYAMHTGSTGRFLPSAPDAAAEEAGGEVRRALLQAAAAIEDRRRVRRVDLLHERGSTNA